MRLKLSLLLPEGARNDILLSCDVTATVGELARALIRAGAAGNPELERAAGQRLMPVTLLGRAVGGESILLDPMSPITGSGLQSGWEIRPVAEFGTEDIAERRKIPRLIEDAGVIEVRSGAQRGVRFSLIAGRNLIGRDRACRIRLADRSVSRRHAEILFDPERGFVIRDLDSANGILIDGEPFRERAVSRRCELTLGDACLTLVPGPIPAPVPSLVHAVTHIRAPRVVPRFPSTERELPAPPAPKEAHRLPIVAVLAPLLIGTAMYAITRSPASLIMVVLSPVMMIGAWLDGVFGGRRRSGHETRRFGERLAAERERLDELRRLEIAVRAQEVPATAEVEAAIAGRGALLWTRRPEHRSFLEVRLGDGELRSRTRLVLPPHEDTAPAHRRELEALADRYRDVGPVPVTEHLDRCGCLGIAGRSRRAGGMARALILQLVGLHSPEDLVLACFAGSGHETEWSWLAWLPHVDPVGGPIPTGQLADSPERCTGLLQALEALADARAAHTRERRRTRSDLDAGAQGSTGPSDAAPGPPALPIVIVLVLDGHAADRSRLIALAEVGPDVGIHLVWVADDPTRLPAACRTFVAFDAPPPDGGVCGVGNPGEAASTVAEDCAEGAEAQVGFVRSGTVVPLARAESTEPSTAAELACGFASVEDAATRVLDESDLPRAVALPDLHDIDLLGGAEPIVQAWASSGSILADWRRGDERPTGSLAVVVGQGPAGPTTIDLRSHGPHALVGGTTGAGKSEFLQSWIMSLAASVSPDRIAFLLVDYKGGAAFAECVDLPHTVGLVTDLNPHLVSRALVSLRAELRYREELLARHGAKDLLTMERRSDPATPPMLVIVIDEFAALAGEVPEFVDGVIDIAQRGRSLGLHLIMATQRPAGVITDNLRANTNLRVALRMADESDSTDVIGVQDAAFFDAASPGRGAIKIGPGRIAHFQTGYLGGRADENERGGEIEIRSLGFRGDEQWDLPVAERPRRSDARPARDIERLRDAIVEAAVEAGIAAPRRPWLDELPRSLSLAECEQYAGTGTGDDDERGLNRPVIGLIDDPAAQAQRPLHLDLDEVGNVAIAGSGGTGKTSALITLAVALSRMGVDDPVQLYAIDAAGGALGALRSLPTVGAVASSADRELVGRVLRRLAEVVAERGPRFAEARAGGLESYRRADGGCGSEPRVVLLLDGFHAFRQTAETFGAASPFEALGDIMRSGRSVGVHVVITCDRPAAIPSSLTAALPLQFVLRLTNPHDYDHIGVDRDAFEEAPPGRAIAAGDGREIQFALVGGHGELAAQAAEVDALARDLDARGVARAPRIVNAPALTRLAELPTALSVATGTSPGSPTSRSRPVYGFDTRTFQPVSLPASGLGVIAGPSGSGLSTAMLSCRAALARWAAEERRPLEATLLTFVEDGLRRHTGWDRTACGEDEVAEAAARLVERLGGRPARGGARGGALGDPFGTDSLSDGLFADASPVSVDRPAPIDTPARVDPELPSVARPREESRAAAVLEGPVPEHPGLVVVERAADAEGTAALPQLIALAKAARRSGTLVLFELETGSAGGIWELFSALRQPRWGLTLQPDDAEAQTPFREDLGRVRRADFPPGRGFAIEAGRVTPIHVALP